MARPRKNSPTEHTQSLSNGTKRFINIINCASCSKPLTEEELKDPDRLCFGCRSFVNRCKDEHHKG